MSGNLRSKSGRYSQEKYTLNFDGSHINQAKRVGVGCIIRDNQGELVVAASYNLSKEFSNYCNVAVAEAAALRNGLKLAKQFNIKLNVIKGDSQEVINHVILGCKSSKRSFKKHLTGVRQPLRGIIQLIVGMLDRSEKIELIYREANQVADKLASLGSSRLQGGCKLFINDAELPPQVAELINKDKSPSIFRKLVLGELIKQISDIPCHSQKTGGEPIDHREANQIADTYKSPKSSKLQGGHKIATTHVANLPPQEKCGSKACEGELLQGKVCKKCDELQAKLTKKDNKIGELEVEINILMNQKLKLEGKGRDLEKSMNAMIKELCQMRDEKMKATKREKYINKSIKVVMVGILFYVILF